MGNFNRASIIAAVTVLSLYASGCGEDRVEPLVACATPANSSIAPSTGAAYVFKPDPISSSGQTNLSPSSLNLDDFRDQVGLANLKGLGVLDGAYADVRNGLYCEDGWGAFEGDHEFLYSHGEVFFQEAMTYYWADRYRQFLDDTDVLEPAKQMKVVAHCPEADNAFYVRYKMGEQEFDHVCMGISLTSPGSTYSDDAHVIVHELQHATTSKTYDPHLDVIPLAYDEWGALNETVSDFMALMFLGNQSVLDPRVFSRWALGSFFPDFDAQRGAHRCPTYDAGYPACEAFAKDSSGFSAKDNVVSYSYPDGMGWPYANNFQSPWYLKNVYLSFRGQEAIHNTGSLVTGALWDAYQNLLDEKDGNFVQAKDLMSKMVHKALAALDLPHAANVSPANFVDFSSNVVAAADQVGLSGSEKSAVESALRDRGLYEPAQLNNGWLSVGPGHTSTPGVRIYDNPNELVKWLGAGSQYLNSISTGLNGLVDGGETVPIWFDLQNDDSLTAGSVLLTVEATKGLVEFLPVNFNRGIISGTKAQIRYFKVNGMSIVDALDANQPVYGVPTSNTYFKTNQFFDSLPTTAMWIQVPPSSSGQTETFKLTAQIANGPTETVTVDLAIQ